MKIAEKLESVLASVGNEKRIHYALDRFEAALAKVGNPEKSVKSLIVSGTNGKGSTTLFLSSSLIAAGFKVGTYLSPHLQSPTERLLHNLKPISDELLLSLAQEFLPVGIECELSYFEFLTLLYFIQAKRWGLDFSVLEVGLGGRLDATNVTDAVASLITNISHDHQSLLGDTLPAILNEKMGILRSESLLFTGITEPELLARVEGRCAELDAVYYYSKELRTELKLRSWGGQQILLNGYPFTLNNPSTGTLSNAALAFLTLRIVFPKIPMATLQSAFAKVRNPGRMEIVQNQPRVVLSGDHNPAGIECLLSTLAELKPTRLLTLCAFSPDKPYQTMYEKLRGVSQEILLTRVTRLKESTTDEYRAMGTFEESPIHAVERILAQATPTDTVLITGSLYLIGEIRKLWKPELSFLD